MSSDELTPSDGADEDPVPPPATGSPRRRNRRASAPPTNPEADRSDDAARPAREGESSDGDPRDAWIRDQRPPHWD